jgi:Fe-S-cluster-containing dehydrogenase component
MVGMLYDATVCTGCKACMSACNEANDLPADTAGTGGLWMAPRDLNSKAKSIIKVGKEAGTGRWSYIKRQCMHCLEPACISGCPFKALDKDRWGVVTWTGSRCIGCRYCEIACPFEVPKFEWDRFNPRIVKCELCFHRLSKGLRPGCTEACPTGAVIYGLRADLLAEAKRRIRQSPGKYHEDQVFGETDGGGTQVLYLTHLPPASVGLPKLGTSSVPYYATKVNAVLYKWLSGPVVVFGVFAAAIRRNYRKHEEHRAAHAPDAHLPEQL